MKVIFEGDAEKWKENFTRAMFDITLRKIKGGEIHIEKDKNKNDI